MFFICNLDVFLAVFWVQVLNQILGVTDSDCLVRPLNLADFEFDLLIQAFCLVGCGCICSNSSHIFMKLFKINNSIRLNHRIMERLHKFISSLVVYFIFFYCITFGYSSERHVATHVVSRGSATGGFSGDGCYIFSHCLPLCMGNCSPPPWDPVGTGNFWPVLAACPLPQARLRQRHFRESLSTGGESEKETNSRGPRKLRQTWESLWKRRCTKQPWIFCSCITPFFFQKHDINIK